MQGFCRSVALNEMGGNCLATRQGISGLHPKRRQIHDPTWRHKGGGDGGGFSKEGKKRRVKVDQEKGQRAAHVSLSLKRENIGTG